MKKNCFFGLLLIALLSSCNHPRETVDYRQEMRDFVILISQNAKKQHPGFVVIPQNGVELMADDPTQENTWKMDYLQAIDGCGQEDLFYGYSTTECVTPTEMTEYWLQYLQPFRAMGRILAIDYCSNPQHVANSYQQNQAAGFLSFAAPDRNLAAIPSGPAFQENNEDVLDLSTAKNFLYLINPQNYSCKENFVDAIRNTNYDVVIVDLFFNEDMLTPADLSSLRYKSNGARRLVICYMSIGEAENYRYYWQKSWKLHRPSWLDRENPDWAGNYKVRYWDPEWQNIICGNGDSYLNRILNAGFDGVYLDIIDAFDYYEDKKK